MLHVRQHTQQRVRIRTAQHSAYRCDASVELSVSTDCLCELTVSSQAQLLLGFDFLLVCRDNEKLTWSLCAWTQDCQAGQHSSGEFFSAQGTQSDLSSTEHEMHNNVNHV